MRFTTTRNVGIAAGVATIAVAVLLIRHFSAEVDGSARPQFLRFVPDDATSVIFADLDQLRTSPFLAVMSTWAPQAPQDSEYAQFVRDTGFNYERDLQRAFVAISNRGAMSTTLALGEGNFDRAKIEGFLGRAGRATQHGSLKVYVLPATASERPLSVALLSARRIAITNSENLFTTMSEAVKQPDHSEWQNRFNRLAGSPVFAVVRQDSELQTVLGAAAPGGFRSPQLATLLGQLQWMSIAAKPEGDLLRIVAEGECPADAACSQLRDFLQGIQVLAQNGLNDPKLRQQMNPEEREAYLELLKSANIKKIARPDAQSVRLVLSVTPQVLQFAHSASVTPPASENANSQATPHRSTHKKSSSK